LLYTQHSVLGLYVGWAELAKPNSPSIINGLRKLNTTYGILFFAPEYDL